MYSFHYKTVTNEKKGKQLSILFFFGTKEAYISSSSYLILLSQEDMLIWYSKHIPTAQIGFYCPKMYSFHYKTVTKEKKEKQLSIIFFTKGEKGKQLSIIFFFGTKETYIASSSYLILLSQEDMSIWCSKYIPTAQIGI